MRTALLLLFLLALASVPGSFLPQRGQNPIEVSSYIARHETLGPLFDRLSLFDAFGAPWFAAVYLLLFVSLLGCLGPRIRLHARALRTPPPVVPRVLTRLPVHDRWESDAVQGGTLEQARRALRRSRWRVVERDGALSAEKGYLRETGNLLFHVSLVVLLIGIAVGGLFGFKGTVLIKEGDGFANTVLAYDDINPGRRFDASRLVPFNLVLDRFSATYAEDGKATDFNADLRYATGDGAPDTPYDLRVNHPLHLGGAKTYLLGHGYAPEVVITDAAGNRLERSVVCLPQNAAFLSTCTIKVPDASGEPLAFEGIFTPTTLQPPNSDFVTSIFPAADAPALTVQAFRGPLDPTATSIYSLGSTAQMTSLDGGKATRLDVGDSWSLPGGGSIRYVGTKEWVTLQVTQDPGKLIALGGSVGMVLGLCLSLFVRRRRLWVRLRPAGAGEVPGRTVVEVAGLARTGPEAFAAEFEAITERLRATAPPVRAPSAPPVSAPQLSAPQPEKEPV